MTTMALDFMTRRKPGFSEVATPQSASNSTAEFDDLLKESFGPKARHRPHGEATPAGRARLRAEVDALVAHLYALTEPAFTHILGTFPLGADETKSAMLAAFRSAG